MELGSVRVAYQRLCVRLLRVCDSVRLLSQPGASDNENSKLGAFGVGQCYNRGDRDLRRPWEEVLHATCCVCGRSEARRGWISDTFRSIRILSDIESFASSTECSKPILLGNQSQNVELNVVCSGL